MLEKGGFHLCKWISNCPSVLNEIPSVDKVEFMRLIDLTGNDEILTRTLGVAWHVGQDLLRVRVKLKQKSLTRRGLLSALASIYDPIGIVAPVVVLAKILFQSECKRGTGWDDPLSEETVTKWNRWSQELPVLEELGIGRCLWPHGSSKNWIFSIHVFSDASTLAYGSVAYLVMKNSSGEFHSTFLLAKSRLAPLKVQTVVRLELSAALLSVQIVEIIRREFTIKFDQVYYWCDSMTVLGYI